MNKQENIHPFSSISNRNPLIGIRSSVEGRFITPQRLGRIARLSARAQATNVERAMAPQLVLSAMRELNEIAELTNGVQSGREGFDDLFQQRLSDSVPSIVGQPTRDRAAEVLASIVGMRDTLGLDGPCDDSLDEAVSVLRTALTLDVLAGDRHATRTFQAGVLPSWAHADGGSF